MLDQTYWRFETLPEKRRADFFRDGCSALGLGDGVRQIERRIELLGSTFMDISRTLSATDEARTLREIRDVGEAADRTNRVILSLTFLAAATTAIEFARFVSALTEERLLPVGHVLVASATFLAIVLLVVVYYVRFVKRHPPDRL